MRSKTDRRIGMATHLGAYISPPTCAMYFGGGEVKKICEDFYLSTHIQLYDVNST